MDATLANDIQSPDAIMEVDIFNRMKLFLSQGGTPQMVIRSLSDGYVGYAEMCNLVCKWLRKSGVNDSEIVAMVEEHFDSLIVEHFDPKKADQIFNMDSVCDIIQYDYLRPVFSTMAWYNVGDSTVA